MSMLKFSPWLILLLISLGVYASDGQHSDPESLTADSLQIIKPDQFVRIGFDLSAVGRQFVEPEVQQYEFSLDTEVRLNWFAVLEGGFMRVASDREEFEYSASGFFLRAGADYNLLGRTQAVPNDLVVFGARYAFGRLSHQSPFFQINNPYWGDLSGSVDKSSYSLHWVELSAGIKTEILQNLFLGWNLKTRIRLGDTRDPEIQPYYIGGFGHGKRRAPVMVHFSVYYRIGM